MSATKVRIEEKEQEDISIKPLKEKEIARLVKKAMEEGRTEARYILELEVWNRQGPSFIDKQDYEIIYGEADVVTIEEWSEPYPYRAGAKIAVIPKTLPVIVRVEYRNNTVDPEEHEIKLYVFTKDGWKMIKVM